MLLRHVLVVDDEPDVARCVAETLRPTFRVEIVSNGAAALGACALREFDVVVSDVRMAGMDGMELMTRLHALRPFVPVILVTAQSSVATAVESVKRGAYHYLARPFEPEELRRVVMEASTSRRRDARLSGEPWSAPLVGKSAAMAELQTRIELLAATTSPALIVGETGTGKELVARAIHAASARKDGPFVAVNGAAIPEALLESEMFGHVRGSFSGATQAHRGYFAQADHGTLLLDEIGDMPLGLQAKLLRALQAGEVHAVGAERVEHPNVRIIAATHRNLPDLVKTGQFREDLFYRLNVLTVRVPTLRARASDVRELSMFFLAGARARAPTARATSIRDDLLQVLERRAWVGNVRELESTIERLVVLSPDAELTPDHLALIDDEALPADAAPEAYDSAEPFTIDLVIRRHVAAVLARTHGNKSRAARILGIDLSTLYRWQEKWRGS